MANQNETPFIQHALWILRVYSDDNPPLARDCAIGVHEEGGHHLAYQFLIDYFSPNGMEPNNLLLTRYKNFYDRFQL